MSIHGHEMDWILPVRIHLTTVYKHSTMIKSIGNHRVGKQTPANWIQSNPVIISSSLIKDCRLNRFIRSSRLSSTMGINVTGNRSKFRPTWLTRLELKSALLVRGRTLPKSVAFAFRRFWMDSFFFGKQCTICAQWIKKTNDQHCSAYC